MLNKNRNQFIIDYLPQITDDDYFESFNIDGCHKLEIIYGNESKIILSIYASILLHHYFFQKQAQKGNCLVLFIK